MGEWLVARMARSWLVAGPSRSSERCLSPLARIADAIVFGIGLAGLVAIALWSVAEHLAFPCRPPTSILAGELAVGGVRPCDGDMDHARGRQSLPLWWRSSLSSPASSTRLAPATRPRGPCPGAGLPAPAAAADQLSAGCQVLLVRLDLDGTLTGLAWMHLVFVLPYTVLMLRGPYLAFDPRWLAVGRSPRPRTRGHSRAGPAAPAAPTDPRGAGGRLQRQRRPVPADAVRGRRPSSRR